MIVLFCACDQRKLLPPFRTRQVHKMSIHRSRDSVDLRNRFVLGSALAFAGAIAVGACSGSPTTPPVIVNTPPTIESLTITGPRAEADSPIQVTATVKARRRALFERLDPGDPGRPE